MGPFIGRFGFSVYGASSKSLPNVGLDASPAYGFQTIITAKEWADAMKPAKKASTSLLRGVLVEESTANGNVRIGSVANGGVTSKTIVTLDGPFSKQRTAPRRNAYGR